MNQLRDGFKRKIDYMRISITDRCNLRCIYCMPAGLPIPIQYKEILKYEEIVRIVKIAISSGVRRIRLTGGEPLIRKNVVDLVKMLKEIKGIEELSLTTNGIFLAGYAEELARAGLDRVNISLDSLDHEKYKTITGGGNLDDVLEGIKAAEKQGLIPIKINMVPVRGVNEDEIVTFASLTFKAPYQIRFIEFMPFGSRESWTPERFISMDEIKLFAEKAGVLHPVNVKKSGPARYYKFDGASGVLGFISPLSNHFCNECNRLRLTADGKLRPCLFSETEIDLKSVLRSKSSSDEEIERLINLAVQMKPRGHNINLANEKRTMLFSSLRNVRPMYKIGG